MDIFLAILAGLMILLGIVGCVLPVIPGPPLAYAGLLLLHFTKFAEFSLPFLVITGCLSVLAAVMDNILPVIGAERLGGTKYGITGSTVGLIAGLFILTPFGIILFPFLGALLGEMFAGKRMKAALKPALGSFFGFLAGVVFKLVISCLFAWYYIASLANHLTVR